MDLLVVDLDEHKLEHVLLEEQALTEVEVVEELWRARACC